VKSVDEHTANVTKYQMSFVNVTLRPSRGFDVNNLNIGAIIVTQPLTIYFVKTDKISVE